MKQQKLTNNGTEFNFNAEEILNSSLNEIISIENQRRYNIGRGNR